MFFKLILMVAFATLSLVGQPADAALISAGQMHTCVWDGSPTAPKCFGNNDQSQLSVPEIHNLFDMQSGAWHTCALHEVNTGLLGISCWGHNGFKQLVDDKVQAPNPIALSVGRWHNCALHRNADGTNFASCWGRNNLGQTDVPANLENPDALYAGADYSCVRHHGGEIRCWGGAIGNFPAEHFARVRPGSGLVCSAVRGEIQDCWTNDRPGADASMQIAGKALSCRLDNGLVACNPAIPTWQPTGTLGIAVGDWHVCAVFADRYECRASVALGGESGQTGDHNRQLSFGPFLASAEQLPLFLNTLGEFVYSFDSEMLNGWAKLATTTTPGGRALMTAVTRHFLLDCGYRKLQDRFLGRALQTIDQLIAAGTVPNLKTMATTPESRMIASRMTGHALVSARNLVLIEDRKTAEELITALSLGATTGSTLDQDTKDRLTAFARRTAQNPYLTARMSAVQVLATLL